MAADLSAACSTQAGAAMAVVETITLRVRVPFAVRLRIGLAAVLVGVAGRLARNIHIDAKVV